MPIDPYARARPTFPLHILSSLLGSEESNMESIIDYIMQNDPNRYGNPPASKTFVENLERIKVDAEFLTGVSFEENAKREKVCSCSVCKDEFEIEQILLKLPCRHYFHRECILPWLKERNSCPTCRFELPVDEDENKNSVHELNNDSDQINADIDYSPEIDLDVSEPLMESDSDNFDDEEDDS
jgi:E3 ubiquitin-protein ligase RNF115/126